MEPTLPSHDEMQRACGSRDASYDGIFFLAVTSTGVFCRPSCPARKPRPENVRYFPTAGQALFAGFRPCLRCRPLETDGRRPQWVAELLDAIEADPGRRLDDRELHRRGLEPARVRRYFQKEYGMTFHAYRRARRLGGALDAIRRGERPEDAGWDSGYQSASGFRDAFARVFGVVPGSAGEVEPITVSWLESPVGPLLLGATERGVALLEFTDRRALESQLAALRKRLARALVPGTNPLLERARGELGEYFHGLRQRFEVPTEAPGTPFEERVWRELLTIPYGETRSYEAIAAALGRPGGSRAVGQANGRNRVAILIPCHRVVNKNGELGGYGGGLWRKRFLLELERHHRRG